MVSLPSARCAALKVIGRYLDPQDALRCRLAARCFAPVTAKQLPTSCIRVVANSFQLQLQHESSTSSRSAAIVTSTDPPTQDVGRLLIASEDRQHLNAPAGKPLTAAATPVAAAAEDGDDVTCSPAFRSRTAASLARAAAADYSKAVLYVDVIQEYRPQTWQELFGALLSSSSSISALTVVEYSSTSLNKEIEDVMAQRRAHADTTPRTGAASSLGASAAAAAAVGTAGSSDWLPSLVSAYTSVSPNPGPALKHLELQLPAPLPIHLQPLLVQLTGLKTLTLYPIRVWPLVDEAPVEPELGPHELQSLTQLSRLESLTCCVAAPTGSLEDSPVNVMLQQAFSNLARHMTHLSFGTSHSETYYNSEPKPRVQLSAPLVSMYDLRSLVCKQKFSLDTDDALKVLGRETSGTLGVTGSSSSSSSNSPRLQIAPSLTKLVLSNRLAHGSVLQLLAGKGINTAAAARPRSQLVHLELDYLYGAVFPIDEPSQLAGLRYLKAVVQESDELTSLCKSSLTSRLQGLTLTCTSADWVWYDSVVKYRPMQSVTSFTALRSLAIIAGQEVILHPVQDLEFLCNLTHLSHLTITKRYGEYECIELGTDAIRNLPCGLHSLVLKLYPHWESRDEKLYLKFALGAFPSGLTAVKFEGFFVELVDDNVAVVKAITEMMASSSSESPRDTVSVASLREPANGAAPVKASLNSLSGICGGSSDSGTETPFPSLELLSADFSTTDRAQEFLRCCRNLKTLNIRLPVPPGIDDEVECSPSKANTVSLQLSDWCPQLSNLRLTLTGNSNIIHQEIQPADGLFEMIWPGVPTSTCLQELAITAVGTLSYNTIMPCLAALSCLPRLRDLTLHFKLEVGCLRAENANKHQQKCEQEGHSAAASSSDFDEHPRTGFFPGAEENAGRGRPVMIRPGAIHKLGVHDLLFKALHDCTGLRRLVLDEPIVIVEDGGPVTLGKSVTIDFVFGQRSRLMQLERGLRNCLVLGSDQHVDGS